MIKLINGDAIKQLDKMIAEGIKVDAIITDIPYGVTQNKVDVFPKREFFTKIWQITNVFVTSVQGKAMVDTINAMPKSVRWYDLIWDKQLTSGFLNSKRQPLRRHEQILVMYKKQPTYNPQMWEGAPLHGKGSAYLTKKGVNQNYGKYHTPVDTREGSTLKYPQSIVKFLRPKGKGLHPTQKPTDLYEYLISTYTNEGETIYDPFMGSGTTGVAAKKLGRSFIGSELNKEFFAMAKKRINR